MSSPPRIVLFATREAWAEDDAGVRALFTRLCADDSVVPHVEDLGPDDLGESDLVVVVSPATAPRLAAPTGYRGDHIILLLGDGPTPPTVPVYHYPRDLDALLALLALLHSHTGAYRLPQPASADQHAEDTGFLATPFESVRGVTRSSAVEQVYLNVWFPKFEPRAPRFVVDEPIDMHVDLGPQRRGAQPGPISESLKDRLRRLARIDVWVQCADADVTPGDGTLELPWPTNVLTFQLVPRRPGGLRIVVVLLIKNQPVHRLEREVQVQDRGAR